MIKQLLICFILLAFFAVDGYAQLPMGCGTNKLSLNSTTKVTETFSLASMRAQAWQSDSVFCLPVSIIANDAAVRHLPFFCKGEHIMDKKLPIPVRLRIGSIQQSDWLERKPSAIKPE
jgi:hypothetical protein